MKKLYVSVPAKSPLGNTKMSSEGLGLPQMNFGDQNDPVFCSNRRLGEGLGLPVMDFSDRTKATCTVNKVEDQGLGLPTMEF